MTILEDFRSKDFVEQINILTKIQNEGIAEAIPGLFDLYRTPLKDTMVDHLVITSLQSLLAVNEAEVAKRLKEGDLSDKKICINCVAINGFLSVLPLLHGMLEDDKNAPLFSEIIQALSKIRAAESLDSFRRLINHHDELTSTLCIEMLGVYKDADSIDHLTRFIEDAEKADQYETCSLQAGMAVQSLSQIKTDKALSFLVSKIHHKNATLRRRIQDDLIKVGADIIPYIEPVFGGDDDDRKILASNILGFIGNRKGGDVLIQAIDSGKASSHNVRYAIYEAFGRIPSLKGLMCLMDILKSEDDDLLLLAVVTALNEQVNPGVITAFKDLLAKSDQKAQKIMKALVSSKATNIFKHIYEDAEIAAAIISMVIASRDPEVRAVFSSALSGIEGERPKLDLEKISSATTDSSERGVLAVDDSKAMLSFYGSIAADLGLKIWTAMNGKEALDLIESGQEFDLVITDMNMPIMDGIEFVRQLRNSIGFEDTPVIMVTTESEQSQRELALKVGVNSFLTKPFTLDIIKDRINSISSILS